MAEVEDPMSARLWDTCDGKALTLEGWLPFEVVKARRDLAEQRQWSAAVWVWAVLLFAPLGIVSIVKNVGAVKAGRPVGAKVGYGPTWAAVGLMALMVAVGIALLPSVVTDLSGSSGYATTYSTPTPTPTAAATSATPADSSQLAGTPEEQAAVSGAFYALNKDQRIVICTQFKSTPGEAVATMAQRSGAGYPAVARVLTYAC